MSEIIREYTHLREPIENPKPNRRGKRALEGAWYERETIPAGLYQLARGESGVLHAVSYVPPDGRLGRGQTLQWSSPIFDLIVIRLRDELAPVADAWDRTICGLYEIQELYPYVASHDAIVQLLRDAAITIETLSDTYAAVYAAEEVPS